MKTAPNRGDKERSDRFYCSLLDKFFKFLDQFKKPNVDW